MSSIDTTLNQINSAIPPIIIVISLINIVFGGVGLILNVFVFTRTSLRREPCSLYFFSSTWFNLFIIFVLIPVRIASEGYNIEIGNYNFIICKIEFFAFYIARTIPCWLIVLACVDRCLNSSTKASVRQISSYKTARLAIGITIITIIILHIHMPIYYEISYVPDQFGNITPACYGQKGIYRTFIAFWAMVSYSLCPSFLMLFFGFLTLKNLRRHRQILPRTTQINQTARRVDTQLGRMLAAQVLVIVIATLPFSIYRLYASFTLSLPKSTLRIAQENFAFKFASVFTYFAHSTSFYLYTLTGTVFRKELFKVLRLRWYPNQTMVTMTQFKMQNMSILPSNRQITATNNNGT